MTKRLLLLLYSHIYADSMSDSEHKLKLIENQARRNERTPREHCIVQIQKWRRRLEHFSDDFRELSEEEFALRLESEIRKRENE